MLHTRSKTSCLKPSVTASRVQKALLCLLSKTYYLFTGCVGVCVCVSSRHTCTTCIVVSGYFWTWQSQVALDTRLIPDFLLIYLWFWLCLQAFPRWLKLPPQRVVEGPEDGKIATEEGLCWNQRKYEWWREGRTVMLKRRGWFQVSCFNSVYRADDGKTLVMIIHIKLALNVITTATIGLVINAKFGNGKIVNASFLLKNQRCWLNFQTYPSACMNLSTTNYSTGF